MPKGTLLKEKRLMDVATINRPGFQSDFDMVREKLKNKTY
jgi:hypothetical protein